MANGLQENLAVVLHGKGDLKVELKPLPPKPGPNEIQLTTLFCGLCGSDMHMFKTGDIGPSFIIQEPLVLGHEATARVLEVGSNVNGFKVGDIVTMEPAIPCGDCDDCRSGHYNVCPMSNQQSKGLPPADGFLQRVYNHPSNFCYKLPDGFDPKLGAFSEPLAVIVHASRVGQLKIGHRVLVTGAGTIGLLAALVSKLYGAAHIVVADIIQTRLDLAKKLGADEVVLLKKEDDPFESGKRIKESLGGPFDVVFECTGSETCTQLAVVASRYGGKVVAVGIGPDLIKVPLSMVSLKEIDIIGVCRYNSGCFKLAVHFLSLLRVPLESIVTHIFPLKEISNAFETMSKGEGLKMMIDCRPNSEEEPPASS